MAAREYSSFRAFMEQLIVPMQASNPHDKRLDGQPSGGNREVVGYFWHDGRRWKVHADTHYRQLLIAYEALKSGQVQDPFVEHPTVRGTSLDLIPALRSRSLEREKHLYIYSA
jgi:hypothetical protein